MKRYWWIGGPVLLVWLVWGVRPAPPVPAATVRVAVIGDYGDAGPSLAAVAALVDGWQPAFIVTTGDNNYPNGAADTIDANIGQYFHSYIGNYQGSYGPGASTNQFFPSLGNHDWVATNAQPYLDYFTLPGDSPGGERYYQFTWGPLHLFAVDSDPHEPDGITAGSRQAQWLQCALQASTAPWQLVYLHHAPYSSGQHGSTTDLRWPYAAWGADAVLAGHDHHYEHLLVGGLHYFVVGTGGSSLYPTQDQLPESQHIDNADYGAMLIEASDTTLQFQYYWRTGDVRHTVNVSQPVVVATPAVRLHLPLFRSDSVAPTQPPVC